MNQLTDLAVSLEKAAEKLPAISNDMAKKAAMLLVEDLALNTPVDVGTAVSNWQISLDVPNTQVIPALAPSPRGKKVDRKWTHTVSPDITRQNNLSLLMSAASDILSTKQPGQEIFVTNNVSYIGILDEGSSEQAPAGFADRALILAQSVVDGGLNLG